MTPVPQAEPEWDQLRHEFNAACAQSVQAARAQLAHEMNQLLRRFRRYENEKEWVRLVMEGAGNYTRQAALFAVQGEELQLRASVNCGELSGLRLPAKEAAAFDAVLRSKEAVTALRTVTEVGVAFSAAIGLAYLFPIFNGSRVAAILFAAGEESEADLLELVANMAASSVERQTNSGLHAQIAAPTKLQAPLPERRLPVWADLTGPERTLHSQAARYARVTVAELQLFKPAACRMAREKGDLYTVLSKEIEKARETYRQRFMILPSMTDYLHREVITFILGGDGTKLGADYPGELS